MGRTKFPAKFAIEDNLDYGYFGVTARSNAKVQDAHAKTMAARRMLMSMFGDGKGTGEKEFQFNNVICQADGSMLPSQGLTMPNSSQKDQAYNTGRKIIDYFNKNKFDELIIFNPADMKPHYLKRESVGEDYVFTISEEVADVPENMKDSFAKAAKTIESLKRDPGYKATVDHCNDIINEEYNALIEKNGLSKTNTDWLKNDGIHVPEKKAAEDYRFKTKADVPSDFAGGWKTDQYNAFTKSAAQYITSAELMATELRDSDYEYLEDRVVNDMLRSHSGSSYDDFVQAFEIPENERLSVQQISERDEISEIALRNATRAAIELDKGHAFPQEGKFPMALRFFNHTMVRPGSQNMVENKRLYRLFQRLSDKENPATDAEKVEIGKEVEKRYKELLSKSAMLDKKYSDRELAEKWPELKEVCDAVSMEYVEFNAALKKKGIDINNKFRKQMDAFHQKAEAFEKFHQNRMDYMCSQHYRFGGEKNMNAVLKDPMKQLKIMQSPDQGLAKTSMAAQLSENGRLISSGISIMNQLGHDNVAGYFSYDSNTQKMTVLSSPSEIATAMENGLRVAFAYKDGSEPQVFVPVDLNTYPAKVQQVHSNPKINNQAAIVRANDAVKSFDKKVEEIYNQKETPQEIKDMEEDILYQQYKLSAIVNNIDAPGNRKEMKATVADLMARISIKEALEKKDASPEDVKKSCSPEEVKKVAKELMAQGVIDKVCEKLPTKNAAGVLNMKEEDMFRTLSEATKEVEAEKKMDTPQAEKDGPDAEKDAPEKKTSKGGPQL